MSKLVVVAVILILVAGLFVVTGSWDGFQNSPTGDSPEKPPTTDIQRVTAAKPLQPEAVPPSEPKPEPKPQPEPEKHDLLEAEMTLFLVADSPTRVHLEGTTNLPPGTELQVTIIPEVRVGNIIVREDQTFVTQQDAIRQTGVHSVRLNGEAVGQPANVLSVIGRKGEYLTGPFAGEKGFEAAGEFKISGKPWRRLPILLTDEKQETTATSP